MKILRQVNSSSNFASSFIVMTHNSSVNIKLIHFLLWIKGSHESLNFETFECSGKSFPNSSCHFPNHKSVFVQILQHSSVSWNITLLVFLAQTLYTLFKKIPLKFKFLRLSSTLVKICHIPHITFPTTSQFFFRFCINLQCHQRYLHGTFLDQTLYILHNRNQSKFKFWEFWVLMSKFTKLVFLKFCVTLQCHNTFFSWDSIYFQQKDTIKVQISWNFTWVMVLNMTWEIWWIFTQPLKRSKISFRLDLFEVWATKIQRSYLSWHWTIMQNLNKPWPCGFKNSVRNFMNIH